MDETREIADDAEVARIGAEVAARWAAALELLGRDWPDEDEP